MVLWRISKHATLNGIGGLAVAGRWHTAGKPVVYCAQNPATSVLEVLVHLQIDPQYPPLNFQLLKIEGPDTLSIERLDPTRFLKQEHLSRSFGDAWLLSRRTLLLEVPSILVPETWNCIINPLHPEASSLKITKTYKHPFDPRLF